MRVCVRCLQKSPREDANFCVFCGWPLVQQCPYECGELRVPLLTGSLPTSRCPSCENPFKVCADPHCGRLHRYSERTCQNHRSQRLLEPIPGWPIWGGNGARTFAAPISEAVSETGPWEPTHLTGEFPNPIGPLVVAAGEVIYLVGRSLQFWQPGSPPRTSLLDETIPDQMWRMAAVGGAIFCVGEKAVFVHPIGRGKRWKLEGEFVAHGSIDTDWVGIRKAGTRLSALVYKSDGELIAEHRLGETGPVLMPVTYQDSIYLPTVRGSIWRLNAAGAKEIGRLPEDQYQYALNVDDSIFCISQGGAGVAIASMRVDGRVGPRFPIEKLVDLSCPPMALQGRLLLVGRQPDRLFNIDALTLRTGYQPTHGYLSVESAVALENGGETYAVLAGGDLNQKAVTIIKAKSGHLVAQPFRSGGRASIKMIAANNMLFVATSQPGDNRIRAYQL